MKTISFKKCQQTFRNTYLGNLPFGFIFVTSGLAWSSHQEQGRPAPVTRGLLPPSLPPDRQRFPAGQPHDWDHFVLPSLLSGLPALFIFNAFDSFPCCFDQATSSHLLPPGGVNSSYCSICRPQTHRRADFAMPASQVSISKY